MVAALLCHKLQSTLGLLRMTVSQGVVINTPLGCLNTCPVEDSSHLALNLLDGEQYLVLIEEPASQFVFLPFLGFPFFCPGCSRVVSTSLAVTTFSYWQQCSCILRHRFGIRTGQLIIQCTSELLCCEYFRRAALNLDSLYFSRIDGIYIKFCNKIFVYT